MRRLVLTLIVLASSAAVAFSQSGAPPKEAIDITDAEIHEVLKHAPPAVDQQLRIVDIGTFHLVQTTHTPAPLTLSTSCLLWKKWVVQMGCSTHVLWLSIS